MIIGKKTVSSITTPVKTKENHNNNKIIMIKNNTNKNDNYKALRSLIMADSILITENIS